MPRHSLRALLVAGLVAGLFLVLFLRSSPTTTQTNVVLSYSKPTATQMSDDIVLSQSRPTATQMNNTDNTTVQMNDTGERYRYRGECQNSSNYFLPPAFVRNVNPSYDTDTQERTDLCYQWNVYNTAGYLAHQNGANGWLIDVGCGNGRKGIALYEHGLKWVGIDWKGNLEKAEARLKQSPRYRSGGGGAETHEFDISNGEPPDLDPNIVRGAVVISSDVIEHLVNPEKLLAFAKALLNKGAYAVVLSTPDRAQLVKISPTIFNHEKCPFQKDVQFWTAEELRTLIVCNDLLGDRDQHDHLMGFNTADNFKSGNMTGVAIVMSYDKHVISGLRARLKLATSPNYVCDAAEIVRVPEPLLF